MGGRYGGKEDEGFVLDICRRGHDDLLFVRLVEEIRVVVMSCCGDDWMVNASTL